MHGSRAEGGEDSSTVQVYKNCTVLLIYRTVVHNCSGQRKKGLQCERCKSRDVLLQWTFPKYHTVYGVLVLVRLNLQSYMNVHFPKCPFYYSKPYSKQRCRFIKDTKKIQFNIQMNHTCTSIPVRIQEALDPQGRGSNRGRLNSWVKCISKDLRSRNCSVFSAVRLAQNRDKYRNDIVLGLKSSGRNQR